MKFVVSASTLLKHLTDVSRIMQSNVNMTLLNYALLSVRDQMLTLQYTDLAMTIVTSFPLEAIEEEGEVCVPLRLLMNSVKQSPDVPLHFDIEMSSDKTKGVAKVILGDGKREGNWSFNVMSAEDYFESPMVDGSKAVSVDLMSDVVASGLEKTLYCAAPASSNNQISVSTVHVEFTPEGVWFGATDMRRIAKYTCTDVKVESESSITLQSKTAQVLAALLPSTAEEMQISFDDRFIRFALPSVQIYAVQAENRYPEVNQFLLQPIKYEVVVNTRLLLDSVLQVAPFSTPSTMNAQYEFSDSKIQLEAYSETYEASASQVIACEYSGAPFKIMLSIPLFSEILAKMSSQEVRLKFDGTAEGRMEAGFDMSGTFVIIQPAQPAADGVDYTVYLAAMIA